METGSRRPELFKARAPKTQVLMVTVYADQDLFHKAVSAGAAGYVLKDISPANLAKAIRAVHDGKTMSIRILPGKWLTTCSK